MSDGTDAGPTRATAFDVGSTCPFCQETIAEGQLIVRCRHCGSLHHDTCWVHNKGCASYHCDTKVRLSPDEMRPELVITAGETERVVVPPPRARMTSAEAARPFIPPKPARLSMLAVASCVLAGASAVGMLGVFAGSGPLMALGIAMAIAAITVGVVALVAINTGRKVYGFAPAAAGILLSGLFIMVYALRIERGARVRMKESAIDMSVYGSMPSEEELAGMEEWKARAMRANVIIRCSSKSFFFGETRLGSGVIMRVAGGTAYILTNKHIVGAKDEGVINVVFYNGEESAAVIRWLAPDDLDAAVISCQALTLKDFKPTQVAEKVATQGERVFAIGNPMLLSWSYTEGVISSIRHKTVSGADVTIYQTQTPINQGNSGGGLYEMSGRLLGINSWTQDKSVSEGLSFAISAGSIMEMMDETERERLVGGDEPPAVDPAPEAVQ